MSPSQLKKYRKRKRIYDKYNGRCYICKKQIDFSEMTIDHIIPRSDRNTKKISHNLACCCFTCNYMKACCENSIKENGYLRGNSELILKGYSYFKGILQNAVSR